MYFQSIFVFSPYKKCSWSLEQNLFLQKTKFPEWPLLSKHLIMTEHKLEATCLQKRHFIYAPLFNCACDIHMSFSLQYPSKRKEDFGKTTRACHKTWSLMYSSLITLLMSQNKKVWKVAIASFFLFSCTVLYFPAVIKCKPVLWEYQLIKSTVVKLSSWTGHFTPQFKETFSLKL